MTARATGLGAYRTPLRTLVGGLLLGTLAGCHRAPKTPPPGAAPEHSDSAFAAMQRRGAMHEAMGVDQYTSAHHFDDLPDGGRIELQREVDDSAGVEQIRRHLRHIARAFAGGDFRIPDMVHDRTDIPGTKVMREKRDLIRYEFRELPRGGEVRIFSRDPEAIQAVHAFLAFQRREHRVNHTARTAIVNPSWDVQYADTAALFIGLSAVDSSVVWASGSGGRVARTTDGGATWTVRVVPGADSLQFRDVQAFSASDAVVLSIGNGPASRIYVTHDGGATWTLAFRNDDPKAFFDCMAFWDRERGFALSDSHDGEFTLLRTDDGGRSWRRIDPAVVPNAHPGEGSFAASGTCTAARPGGLGWFGTGASGVDTRVIRTTDYGATWHEAVTPIASRSSGEGITSLTFLDDRHGAAFGSRLEGPDSSYANVIRTRDGGATWALTGGQALGGVVYGGSYVPGAATPTLVAVGPSGSAWSADDGATWTTIDTTNSWTVTFVSINAGWSAGRGHISRFHNGAR